MALQSKLARALEGFTGMLMYLQAQDAAIRSAKRAGIDRETFERMLIDVVRSRWDNDDCALCGQERTVSE